MKLQALKVLVVIMGLMIFVGLGFLAYGIAAKFTGGETARVGPAEPMSLTLPKGAEVRETTLDGERVLVRVALPDGSMRLLIFDIGAGRELGRIDLKRAP